MAVRRNMVAGNWKMNKTLSEALSWAIELNLALAQADRKPNCQLLAAVPYPYLAPLRDLLVEEVLLAAQNCHSHASGAYTGEVSANMLAAMGISHVVLGHSERRQYFGEEENLLRQKTLAALEAGLHVIFCCGEPLSVREQGEQSAWVEHQLHESLFGLPAEQFSSIIIAYEPIWAIGTGVTASPEQAEAMHLGIRQLIAGRYSSELADTTTLLYGGSCTPANAASLFAQPNVDGGLIGGASLKVADFWAIATAFDAI